MMYLDDTGGVFWLPFILIIAGVLLSLFLFNLVACKLLNVERKKLFSYNHLNAQHKKVDWTIRIIFSILMVIGFIINMARYPSTIFLLEPYVLVLFMLFGREIVTAIMEWKYAENRNAYILTLLQLVFIAILLTVLYVTDIFGFLTY